MDEEKKPDEEKKQEEQKDSSQPVRKFRCGECGKEFDAESSLNQHKNAVHGPAQQPIPASTSSSKSKINFKKFVPYIILAAVLGGIGYGVYAWIGPGSIGGTGSFVQLGAIGSTHEHADFSIFVNGDEITPLDPSYFLRSRYVHLEAGAGAGSVIHVHATGVTLGLFLRTLGFDLNQNCLTVSAGTFCNEGDKTVKVYVKHRGGEWTQVDPSTANNILVLDGDKFLITYGNETEEEIISQQNAVPDFSAANSGFVGRGF